LLTYSSIAIILRKMIKKYCIKAGSVMNMDEKVSSLFSGVDKLEDALSKLGYDAEISKRIPQGVSKLAHYTEIVNTVVDKDPECIVCSSDSIPLFALNSGFKATELYAEYGSYIYGYLKNVPVIVTPYYSDGCGFILCVRDNKILYKFKLKNN
jgi:hypothetical protein